MIPPRDSELEVSEQFDQSKLESKQHWGLSTDTLTPKPDVNDHPEWMGLPEANQYDFDRRLRNRKQPPKTSYPIKIQRFLNSIVYKIYGSRYYQALYVFVTATALALIYYSVNERAHLLEEAYLDLSTQGQLETEILKINQEWSQERMQEIRQGIASADRRRVFADYQSLANWLREKNAYAKQVNLGFSYTLGEGQAANIDNTLEIPVSITLAPITESNSQSYFQMMEFARHMVSTLWYVDIQEASVESTGAGVTKMTTKISVWVHGMVNSDG